jgi:siroheme synthase-like protein
MSIETKNTLFPVFLKLENFRVLIVGGGKVGLEKVTAVLNNSPVTKVTLVATHVSQDIKDYQLSYPNLVIHQRSFIESDLNDIDLVIVAVNNKDTSIGIKYLAEKKHILSNVADTPEQCDFYLGSIVQKGHVKIAVSTNGKSPTLAKRIRETFEESFPEEINESLENLYRKSKTVKLNYIDTFL